MREDISNEEFREWERIAHTSLYKICLQYGLFEHFPARADWEDAEQEGIIGILKAIRYSQHKRNSPGFLYICCRQAQLRYLFRKALKRHGWENLSYFVNLRDRGQNFTERNLDQLWDLLYSARKKKGDRGLAATNRDVQILLLLSLGWSEKEIGPELGLPATHVHDYRKSMVKKLKQTLLEQTETGGNEHDKLNAA